MHSVCDRPEGLLSLEEARGRLLDVIRPIGRASTIPVTESLGRILSETVVSPIDFPPFANSAMDGYAVRAVEAHPGARLRVVGSLMAGSPANYVLGQGECIRIFTGAPLPKGADAVVVQERVTVEGDGVRLDLEESLTLGANVRRQGEELKFGGVLLKRGTRIGPYELGVLAFAGLTVVPVWERLRIGVLATGDELVVPGERLAPGQIHESNRPVLLALIHEMGHQAVDLGTVPDDYAQLRQALLKGSEGLDALITTGGASEGDADYVVRALGDLGRVSFWKVAVKPGKPFVFGHIGSVPTFGLPGNPVSSAIIFLKLVRPALELLSGQGAQRPIVWRLPLLSDIRRQPGRLEFYRGRLVETEGALWVMPLSQQGSHRLTSLVEGDCLIVLSPEIRTLAVGTLVDVELFRPLSWPLEVM